MFGGESDGRKEIGMEERRKEEILKKLREHGCRITKQRKILLDIILEEECSCCKEIYYKAVKKDKNIGTATVYRMINTLEEIGVISRRNMYRIDSPGAEGRRQHLPQYCCSEECRENCEESISLVQARDEERVIGYNNVYTVKFEDGSRRQFSKEQWLSIVQAGLREFGYEKNQKIRSVEC